MFNARHNVSVARRSRPVRWAAGVALALLAGAVSSCSDKANGAAGKGRFSGPVPVSVAPAVRATIPLEIETFGTAEASETVTIRPQVTGVLTEVKFVKGQEVKVTRDAAGREVQPELFTIDPEPFQATLRQAQATLARDVAQAKNARAEANREAALMEKGISSRTDKEKREADAEAMEATVHADEAAVQTAQLQLGYCTIRSPISGRTGDLLVDKGNLVKANETALVTVNAVHPIEACFSVSQAELPAVQAARERGAVKVLATIPQEPGPAEEGTLSFVDNAIDTSTGMILMRATFKNSRDRLWPGQYLRVTLTLGQLEGALVVPSQAVQNGREGTYVFVVDADKKARMRPLTVVRTYDGRSVVALGTPGESGLTPGELVGTDGHGRLTEKSAVQIMPAVGTPASAPAARPDRSDRASSDSSVRK
ncbi:MAG: efflux RND transporter periplasmic adaptor subunit [Planctomycetota bacterium]|nr:efflux RND transporter periplasmic adaptor subunit [Planctomycetota bacterium]